MIRYIKELKTNIICQLFFSLLWTLTNVFLPYASIILFDNINQLSYFLIFKIMSLYLILIILNTFFQFIYQKLEWKMTTRFKAMLQKDLFYSVIGAERSSRNEKSNNELLSIFNNDVDSLDSDFLSPLVDIIRSVIQLVVYTLALIYFVDWRVATVVIVTTFGAIFVPKLVSKKLSSSRKKQLREYEKYFSKLHELLDSRHLVTFSTIQGISNRHNKSVDEAQNRLFEYGRIKTLSNVINGFVMFMVSFSSFFVIAILLYLKEITVGAAVASFSYIENFIYPIRYVLTDINLIHSSREVRDNIETILSDKSCLRPAVIDDFKTLSIINLSIDYEEKSVLNKTNFSINTGEKVAIIGSIGSGKSSLLKAIFGKGRKTSGDLYLDNKLIGMNEIAALAFYSNQEEAVFSESIEQNISIFGSYSISEMSKQFLKKYFKRELMEYINPQELSGGEKQILCLIRALNSNKKILLLDEPLSSVNREISTAITHELITSTDSTIILTTHNTAADYLEHFDKIYEVKSGNVERVYL